MRTGLLPQLTVVLMTLAACSGAGDKGAASDQAHGAPERVVKEVTITSGTPVTMADLSIEGMSCEMMCGGSIRKALAKLPGVASTDIVFNEGEAQDHAIVTYDPGQVDDAQFIEAVQALHGGQYKVMAITITKQVRVAGSPVEGDEGDGREAAVSVYAPRDVVLPSVFALLSRILRG